jgi:hypothetical protein
MYVLGHDGDRSVRMVDLGRSADATRGDGARVRRVGREEGDVDANGDVVGLRRTVRQRRDRRRDGSHIVFKDWEAADGARLREEDSLVDRVRDEGRLAWARARRRCDRNHAGGQGKDTEKFEKFVHDFLLILRI